MLKKIMSHRTLSAVSFYALFSLGLPACAEEKKVEEKLPAFEKASVVEAVDASIKSVIMKKLRTVRPDLNFIDVLLTDVPELYEVTIAQGGSIYTTASGDFFVVGEIYQVMSSGIENLTEKKRSADRAKTMAGLDHSALISFAPEKEKRAEIFVFTDVDCGYCQLLHKEVPRLNELGVTVSYLAFPRQGVGSPGYEKMASAWCSKDKQKSMNVLKSGGNIPSLVCDTHPVKGHYALGQRMGVTGTPAIVLSNGTLVPGYKKADELAAILGVN